MKHALEQLEEQAHHDLTFLDLSLGVSTYYCENCGALVKLGGDGVIVLFHLHPTSSSSQEACEGKAPRAPGATLKSKIKALDDAAMERLRRI